MRSWHNLFIGFRNYIVNTWLQSRSMGYNSARVIIGDQSEGRFITLSESSSSTADASPSSSGTSAMNRRWITKPSAILSHWICIADVHTSIGDLSPMYRRCVADVNGTFLALVYIAECSPTARRCSAIYRRWCMVALLWRCPNLCIARASGGL